MFKPLFVLVFGAAVASPSAAQEGLPKSVTDGMYVTVAEVRAKSESTFEAFAGAGATSVTRDKFLSTKIPPRIMPTSGGNLLGKLFSLLDVNSDGTLTISEWRQRLQKDIHFADENGDGKITLKELARARKNMSVGDALEMAF